MKNEIFDIPHYWKSAVYMIVNKEKFKFYIGQSRRVRERAKDHVSTLKNGNHANKELQSDFNSGDNFYFMILQKIPDFLAADDFILKLLEKLYVIQALQEGAEVYNIIPFDRDMIKQSKKEYLIHSVCYDLLGEVEAKNNLWDAYFEKIGKELYYDRISKNAEILREKREMIQ